MEYQEFITQSLHQAAEISTSFFGTVTGTTKAGDNNQVLTEADVAIGKHLIKQIEQHFPNHNIIDEEAGVIDKNSEYTWVVDPIDGTSNFANGVPTYGIMLGLLKGAEAIAGGTMLPYFDELYRAEKGHGAFCNDHQIRVTQETNLLNVLVAYGIDGHQENPAQTRAEAKIIGELVLGIRNLRTCGSTFDPMMVARGGYGGCLVQTCKIWDNVALQPILEEAGAVYTDFNGQPMDYTQPLTKVNQNYSFCTAPPALHSQLQQLIQTAGGGRMSTS